MNCASLVVDLMEGKAKMTMAVNWMPGMKERALFFRSKKNDLNGDVIVASEDEVSPAIKIPLDFDVLDGLDDVLLLIAAFVCPDADVTFFAYNETSDKPVHAFSVVFDAKKKGRCIVVHWQSP